MSDIAQACKPLPECRNCKCFGKDTPDSPIRCSRFVDPSQLEKHWLWRPDRLCRFWQSRQDASR
jgi:hypothetical protein